MLNVKIIVGSTRHGRAADRVTPWVIRHARALAAYDVELLDLREWNLPMFADDVVNTRVCPEVTSRSPS